MTQFSHSPLIPYPLSPGFSPQTSQRGLNSLCIATVSGCFSPCVARQRCFPGRKACPFGMTSYGSAGRRGRDFRLRVSGQRRILCRVIGNLWVRCSADPWAAFPGRILRPLGFLVVCTGRSHCLCTPGTGGFLVSQCVW